LLGLGGCTSLEAVRELVNEWARDVPPLQIEVEQINEFPSPFQIVIIQIRRTFNLSVALSRLRERARQRSLDDLATVAPADWIFHLSLVYGSSLSAASWATVSESVHQLTVPTAQCLVPEVEIVAFDDGQELSGGVVALSGAALSNADDHETV
jgi:hypothetical protein